MAVHEPARTMPVSPPRTTSRRLDPGSPVDTDQARHSEESRNELKARVETAPLPLQAGLHRDLDRVFHAEKV